MNSANRAPGIKAYSQVAVQTDMNDASPHRLIQMLMEAALAKIAAAKGFMQNKRIEEKGNQISLTVSIIDSLRASLDKEKGGEIASNLEALYDYMIRKLTEANLTNDTAMLDEVSNLIKTVKEAWDAIPSEAQSEHERLQKIEDQKEQAAAS